MFGRLVVTLSRPIRWSSGSVTARTHPALVYYHHGVHDATYSCRRSRQLHQLQASSCRGSVMIHVSLLAKLMTTSCTNDRQDRCRKRELSSTKKPFSTPQGTSCLSQPAYPKGKKVRRDIKRELIPTFFRFFFFFSSLRPPLTIPPPPPPGPLPPLPLFDGASSSPSNPSYPS